MATRQDNNGYDEFGNPVGLNDPSVINDPGIQIPPLTPGATGGTGQGVTDPAFPPAAPAPAGAGPIPTNPDGSQVGGGTPWDPKTGAPTSSPAGYHWDPNLAMFQPDAQKGTETGTTGGFGDDASILAQIGKWGDMPGADPSLKNDPNYWLGAIKGKGGLNAGNLQYWQDAGVGPTAFFNNPNREGGGGPATFNQPGPQFVGQAPASGNNDFLNQFQAAMLKQLSALNDPNAAQQNAQPAIDANRVSSERGLADENNNIAEQLYAQNPALLHSGALDTLKTRARERATTNQATFAGNAVMSQNALRQQALMSLLGTGAGLGQQASQFNDQMGFNYANLGVNANYNAMLLALQGGGL